MQRGSHKVFVRDSDDRTVVVPWHNRDLKRGTLHALVKGTGLTIDEFQKLLWATDSSSQPSPRRTEEKGPDFFVTPRSISSRGQKASVQTFHLAEA